LQRLRSAQRGERRWPGDQLCKPAEVLRNRCQRELELGTAWPAQSQPAEPQDTLQVRKQHFDTLPVAGAAFNQLLQQNLPLADMMPAVRGKTDSARVAIIGPAGALFHFGRGERSTSWSRARTRKGSSIPP
jgi:hypothetical protein